MKLLLVVFAMCAVARGIIQSSKLMDFEYYWRDWDVNSTIPDDAVAGGVDSDGHHTYIARTVYNKWGLRLPGKASPKAKKMWFEFHRLEHTKTKDVEILCVLNERRLNWVVANKGDRVDSVLGDNVLIFGGNMPDGYTTIGRYRIGNEIQVGRVHITRGKFANLKLSQNGKSWTVGKGYQVLIYVNN